jgi:hypothetical protein
MSKYFPNSRCRRNQNWWQQTSTAQCNNGHHGMAGNCHHTPSSKDTTKNK